MFVLILLVLLPIVLLMFLVVRILKANGPIEGPILLMIFFGPPLLLVWGIVQLFQ